MYEFSENQIEIEMAPGDLAATRGKGLMASRCWYSQDYIATATGGHQEPRCPYSFLDEFDRWFEWRAESTYSNAIRMWWK